MKKLILILIVVMGYNTIYAQQTKELKHFYTDKNKYYPSSINLSRVYYKDIYNYFTPFLGQWKHTNGNQTFILTLWKETKKPTKSVTEVLFYCDEIFGHYQIFLDYGLSTQSLLYTSQMNVAGTSQIWQTVIFSDSVKPNILSGKICDIVGSNYSPNFKTGVEGYMSMKINSGTSPLTARWHITPSGALFDTNQPRNFVIPTNVTLTKI
jgi:hypothetical protein